jgi:hypothetical protein
VNHPAKIDGFGVQDELIRAQQTHWRSAHQIAKLQNKKLRN